MQKPIPHKMKKIIQILNKNSETYQLLVFICLLKLLVPGSISVAADHLSFRCRRRHLFSLSNSKLITQENTPY